MGYFKRGKISKKTITKIIVAVACFCVCSNSGFYKVNAKEEKQNLELTIYNVDDIRYILGYERKYDKNLENKLKLEAAKLEFDSEQLNIVLDVLGDIAEISTTEKIKIDSTNAAIAEFNESMDNGYNPAIVMQYYETAKKLSDSYRDTYGSDVNVKDNDEKVKELLLNIEKLREAKSKNVEIGAGLGGKSLLPLDNMYLSLPFETTNMFCIIATSTENAGIRAMFDCKIDSIENLKTECDIDTGNGIKHIINNEKVIKMSVGPDLKIVYSGNFKVDSNIEKIVKEKGYFEAGQYDVIARTSSGNQTMNVTVQLDNKYIDMLKLYGSQGAIIKQRYILEQPWNESLISLWDELESGRIKDSVEQYDSSLKGTDEDKDIIISEYEPIIEEDFETKDSEDFILWDDFE